MKMTMKVVGLRETEAALKELKKGTARAQTRAALQAGGEVLAREARANAPERTGGTRESVSVGGTLSRAQKALHRKRAEQEVFVGPDDRPQAHLREFGGDGAPPHPFMRPAWDSKREEAATRVADTLMVRVQAAARRAAAKLIKVK